jgi:hypothetical protein
VRLSNAGQVAGVLRCRQSSLAAAQCEIGAVTARTVSGQQGEGEISCFEDDGRSAAADCDPSSTLAWAPWGAWYTQFFCHNLWVSNVQRPCGISEAVSVQSREVWKVAMHGLPNGSKAGRRCLHHCAFCHADGAVLVLRALRWWHGGQLRASPRKNLQWCILTSAHQSSVYREDAENLGEKQFGRPGCTFWRPCFGSRPGQRSHGKLTSYGAM